MISAGQTPANQVGAQTATSSAYGLAPIQFSSYIPSFQLPSFGGNRNSNNVSTKLNSEDGKAYLEDSQKYGAISDAIAAGVNIVGMSLQSALASQSMSNQCTIATKYYETQGQIAGYQREVAIKQLDVQFEAINAQQKMHSEQTRHEERMAKLEGSTQTRLAAIEQQSKTDRARILSVTDAFSRRGYSYGSAAA